MLPKWFDKWNRDNPTDIFGPAILVGCFEEFHERASGFQPSAFSGGLV